eukprot:m.209509 g.209509  ORF g.209509 m.209509 type:complete len:198 (+) comp15046_c0_seq5:200-793(+)
MPNDHVTWGVYGLPHRPMHKSYTTTHIQLWTHIPYFLHRSALVTSVTTVKVLTKAIKGCKVQDCEWHEDAGDNPELRFAVPFGWLSVPDNSSQLFFFIHHHYVAFSCALCKKATVCCTRPRIIVIFSTQVVMTLKGKSLTNVFSDISRTIVLCCSSMITRREGLFHFQLRFALFLVHQMKAISATLSSTNASGSGCL